MNFLSGIISSTNLFQLRFLLINEFINISSLQEEISESDVDDSFRSMFAQLSGDVSSGMNPENKTFDFDRFRAACFLREHVEQLSLIQLQPIVKTLQLQLE